MAGTPGKCVRYTAPGHAPGSDRLNDLPEGVLHRIMSFLTSRQAVQTCVLSRRWRYLWRSVPCINADINEFKVTKYGADEMLLRIFVNRLLKSRDPVASVDTFYLTHSRSNGNYNERSSEDAERWISHALQKKAQVVVVAMREHTFEPDHSVFTSNYLRRLDLNNAYMRKELTKTGEANSDTRKVRCSEDDPMVNDVIDFFVNSGMSSDQIHIKYRS
ncbi:hypothetical protein E2562_008787 [Oryza meyeriana var. granulata]|uniref:F-box domain-containing protein n=1 Tax=Oryza meyeriana var. granulata TaxID=110450 RepID=A0A6G1CZZ2_9ORYZ|nr:hypothetical protein E2562_008787 [Oryza meyeriana var. granulata]